MPKYKYVARDRSGKSKSGEIQATDEADLRRVLRANGLYLTDIKGGAGKKTSDTQVPDQGFFGKKATLQDMVVITRQLSTILRAGVSLVEGLEIVGGQTDKPILNYIFKDLGKIVSDGQSLSSGMAKYPKVFSPLLIAFVEAGETTGNLDQTFESAAMQLDREDNLKRRVKAATTYPKIVLAACLGTITCMLLFVVPVFATIYKQLRAELPAATQLLVTLSDFGLRYSWIGIVFLGLCAYGYKRYHATPGGKRRLDIISLKLPILGTIFRKIAIARFSQTLSSALSSGIPVIRALTLSANTSGNAVLYEAIMIATNNIRDGASIATEIEATGQFTPMVSRMVAAGEATGNIDTMLDEINRFCERDVDYAVEKLTRMIEPLMTIIVGSIVLLILLALYMPVFNLGSALTGSK